MNQNPQRGGEAARSLARNLHYFLQKKLLSALTNLCAIVNNPDHESGGALVEFAVTLPALLLVVTGILVFGLAFSNYLMLTQATAVGARQLAISRGQTLDPCNTVVSAVYAAAPLLKQANLTFSFSLNGVAYQNTTSCPGTQVSGPPTNLVLGTKAVVTVTYPCQLSLFGDLISSGFTLNSQIAELVQ